AAAAGDDAGGALLPRPARARPPLPLGTVGQRPVDRGVKEEMAVFGHPMIRADVVVIFGEERDAQVRRWRAVKERVAWQNEVDRLRCGVVRKGGHRLDS